MLPPPPESADGTGQKPMQPYLRGQQWGTDLGPQF